jgi:hypothetical protein
MTEENSAGSEKKTSISARYINGLGGFFETEEM